MDSSLAEVPEFHTITSSPNLDLHWYGGFAALQPMGWRDYRPAVALILLGITTFGWLTYQGTAASKLADQQRLEGADLFWTHLVKSQTEGQNVQGDCFYYAIKLRDLLLDQGVSSEFNFVRWTQLNQGQTIHVYLTAEIMNETWVMDNMGGIRRFPLNTPSSNWLAAVAPKDCPYEYIGDLPALMKYLGSQKTTKAGPGIW